MGKQRKFVSRFFEYPPELMQNQPLLHISGNTRIHIENHKGIIEYSPDLIRINTSCGILRIHGGEMVLKELDDTNILVLGMITCLEY